jgi:truncated hemoglobin YjbI
MRKPRANPGLIASWLHLTKSIPETLGGPYKYIKKHLHPRVELSQHRQAFFGERNFP